MNEQIGWQSSTDFELQLASCAVHRRLSEICEIDEGILPDSSSLIAMLIEGHDLLFQLV